MFTTAINFWVVIGAAVAAQAVGFLWYSPALFGRPWMKLAGVTPEAIAESKGKGMGKIYLISFLASLVMAYVLAHLIVSLVVVGIGGAVSLGFWAWLGFVATTSINDFLWTTDSKSWQLYVLQNGHFLISIIVMSIVLTLWL